MNFRSLEHYGIEPRKLILVCLAASAATGLLLRIAVGDVLGAATAEIQLIVAALVFYIVASTPRRLMEAAAFSQARDATMLSVAGAACLQVGGSRARTVFLLRSGDSEIARALNGARRALLLGTGVRKALGTAADSLASYSATNVLRGLARLGSAAIEERGEESQGITVASQLAQESKVPIFMTVCLFSPIMLTLYSVFSHLTSPLALAELVVLEFVILEVAFHLCSTERGRR